jgi:hypothetical protein
LDVVIPEEREAFMTPQQRENYIYHDYRQEPIESDEQLERYKKHLSRLNAIVSQSEDQLIEARSSQLPILDDTRSSLMHILIQRQGIVDAIYAYEHKEELIEMGISV